MCGICVKLSIKLRIRSKVGDEYGIPKGRTCRQMARRVLNSEANGAMLIFRDGYVEVSGESSNGSSSRGAQSS